MDSPDWILQIGFSGLDPPAWILLIGFSRLDSPDWILQIGFSRLDFSIWWGGTPSRHDRQTHRLPRKQIRCVAAGLEELDVNPRGQRIAFPCDASHSRFGCWPGQYQVHKHLSAQLGTNGGPCIQWDLDNVRKLAGYSQFWWPQSQHCHLHLGMHCRGFPHHLWRQPRFHHRDGNTARVFLPTWRISL